MVKDDFCVFRDHLSTVTVQGSTTRTIEHVATSAEREQIGEQLLGRRFFDTYHPGRRLARWQLAALAPGYTNG